MQRLTAAVESNLHLRFIMEDEQYEAAFYGVFFYPVSADAHVSLFYSLA